MVQQGNVTCSRCGDFCQGETVRAYGSYYHIYCFSCGVSGCAQDLMTNGFFLVGDEIYCRRDYHKLMGRRCAGCNKYVEGEVISVLQSVYHASCFGCVTCENPFPPNAEIHYDGENFFCETCVSSPVTCKNDTSLPTLRPSPDSSSVSATTLSCDTEITTNECVGCKNEIKSGQALIALNKPWHLWCFKCHKCDCRLTGDYMARNGYPYCERDYHANFGVACDNCGGFITGKVLQAGEKLYHPQCSTCALCGQIFQEGEEMFLQGAYIWHPKCSDKLHGEEKGDKPQGKLTVDYDSEDYLSDSTFPISENYDASRSFNDMSDVTVNEDTDLYSNLMMQRSLSSFNRLAAKKIEDKIKHVKKNDSDIRNLDIMSHLYKKDEEEIRSMIIRVEQRNAEERYRNDVRRGSAPAEDDVRAPLNTTPGCFRDVKPSLMGKCKSPPREGKVSPPRQNGISPSNSNSTGDTPPPKPPPPTKESSKLWHQKGVSVVHNSQNVRRPSFSKAITTGTDSSTSTDSDTFPSTVNTSTSTDGLDILIDRIPVQKKMNGVHNKQKVQRRKSKDGSKIAKDFNFKYASSFA